MASDHQVLDVANSHKKEGLHFAVPEHLLLVGGPSNFSDRVLRALSFQGLNFLGAEVRKIQKEIKDMARYVLQTKNDYIIAYQGSGNGGNESVLRNLTDPGDQVVVAVGGTWGGLVSEMASRADVDALALRKPLGEIYTNEELEDAIIKHKASVLFVTHGEPTGGTVQTLEGLGDICHRHDCLLIVDAVCSIACEPLFMDRWGIDGVTAGSQKAIGVPPGLCIISLSPKAVERMNNKKHPPPYCQDLTLSGIYWNTTTNNVGYHISYSSNNLVALREALAQICEETLEKMWTRHRSTAEYMTEKAESLGLWHVVPDPKLRFSGVVCIGLPKDIDVPAFLDYIKAKYHIEISPGFGPTLNKGLRIGLLGQNSRPEVVDYLTEALQDALTEFKIRLYT